MSDETATAVIEDGSATGSTPAPEAVETAANQVTATDVPKEQANAPIPAPADADDAAYERLLAKAEGRTTPPETSPSTQTAGAETNPAPADPFADLKAEAKRALQRTHRLPPPEVWAGMDPQQKVNLVNQSIAELKDKDRAFQQKQAEKAAEAEPQQPQQPERPPQANAALALPPALLKQIHAVDTTSEGEESMLVPALEAYHQHVMGMIAPEFQRMAGMIEQLQHANSFLVSRAQKAEEAEAGELLKKELGANAEYGKPETQELIRRNAGAFMRAHWDAGDREYTWKQALLDAARSRFYPNLQQNAQQALAKQRTRSIAGSPDRGEPAKPGAKPLTQSDREDLVFEKLSTGKSRAQVHDEMAALR